MPEGKTPHGNKPFLSDVTTLRARARLGHLARDLGHARAAVGDL